MKNQKRNKNTYKPNLNSELKGLVQSIKEIKTLQMDRMAQQADREKVIDEKLDKLLLESRRIQFINLQPPI